MAAQPGCVSSIKETLLARPNCPDGARCQLELTLHEKYLNLSVEFAPFSSRFFSVACSFYGWGGGGAGRRDAGWSRSRSFVMFSLKSHASLSNPNCSSFSYPILTAYLIFQSCSPRPGPRRCAVLYTASQRAKLGRQRWGADKGGSWRIRQSRQRKWATFLNAMGPRLFCSTDCPVPICPMWL